MNEKKNKVAMAMSGGVDSSVAAALLKKQGYDVVGVFMHFWKDGRAGVNRCCSTQALEDARAVARKLAIPFYTLNLSLKFKKEIVDPFITAYGRALTPNPCVACNKLIKFGSFLKYAKLLKCDYIATGHYARVAFNKQTKKYELLKGNDIKKDQSYFLYQLNQKILSQVLFPVGHLSKIKVRKLAENFGLAVAKKHDSQEICFVPETVETFLSKYLKDKPGDMVDVKTKKLLGKHQGLFKFTLGQRKGLGLAGGPWYVVKKDLKKNILYITNDKKYAGLYNVRVKLKQVHWLSGVRPRLPLPLTVMARLRYAQIAKTALLEKVGNQINLKFKQKQLAVTPGQSAVFYQKNKVLGGAIIK